MQGLRDDLKEHVALQRPDSFLAAANTARLKNSLSKNSYSTIEATLTSLLPQLSTAAKHNLPTKSLDDQPVSRFSKRSSTAPKFKKISSAISNKEIIEHEMGDQYVTIVTNLGILLVDLP